MMAFYCRLLPLMFVLFVFIVPFFITSANLNLMPDVLDDVPLGFFSENRARKHLVELADNIGIRRVGSIENDLLATQYLKKELDSVAAVSNADVSVEVEKQYPSGSVSWGKSRRGYFFEEPLKKYPNGFWFLYKNISNVIVRVCPEENKEEAIKKSLLVSAHYDTGKTSPGASDDTVHIASMVEVVRTMAHSNPIKNSCVVFLFNGAEEVGLLAADGFLGSHPWAKYIQAWINLEATGANGKLMLFRLPGMNPYSIGQVYQNSGVEVYGSTMGQDFYDLGIAGGNSDGQIYGYNYKIPGLDLVLYDNGYVYHSPLDNTAHVATGVLQLTLGIQHIGDTVIGLIKAADIQDLTSTSGSDEKLVLFNFLGKGYGMSLSDSTVISSMLPATFIVICLSLLIFCSPNFLKFEAPSTQHLSRFLLLFLSMLGAFIAAVLVVIVESMLLLVNPLSWFSAGPGFVLFLFGLPALLVYFSIFSFFARRIHPFRLGSLDYDHKEDKIREGKHNGTANTNSKEELGAEKVQEKNDKSSSVDDVIVTIYNHNDEYFTVMTMICVAFFFSLLLVGTNMVAPLSTPIILLPTLSSFLSLIVYLCSLSDVWGELYKPKESASENNTKNSSNISLYLSLLLAVPFVMFVWSELLISILYVMVPSAARVLYTTNSGLIIGILVAGVVVLLLTLVLPFTRWIQYGATFLKMLLVVCILLILVSLFLFPFSTERPQRLFMQHSIESKDPAEVIPLCTSKTSVVWDIQSSLMLVKSMGGKLDSVIRHFSSQEQYVFFADSIHQFHQLFENDSNSMTILNNTNVFSRWTWSDDYPGYTLKTPDRPPDIVTDPSFNAPLSICRVSDEVSNGNRTVRIKVVHPYSSYSQVFIGSKSLSSWNLDDAAAHYPPWGRNFVSEYGEYSFEFVSGIYKNTSARSYEFELVLSETNQADEFIQIGVYFYDVYDTCPTLSKYLSSLVSQIPSWAQPILSPRVLLLAKYRL